MCARNVAERVLSLRTTPQPPFEAGEQYLGPDREERYRDGTVE